MAQFTLSEFVGLVTAPGLLVRNQASLVEATNVVIGVPGLIRQRRGFTRGATFQPGVVPSMAYTNEDFIYAYNSAPSVYPGKFVNRYINTAGILSFPTGAPNVNTGVDYGFGNGRLKAFSQNSMLYCNSPTRLSGNVYRPEKPVLRVESAASTQARYAGAPLGMAPDTYNMSAAVYSVLYNGTVNFLLANCGVAYRVTWHRKVGSNRAELIGAPVGRLVVRNVSGTSGWAAATARAVQLRIPIPRELFCTQTLVDSTQWYCKLWRSLSTTDSGQEATDSMNLVADVKITAGDITNGYVLYQDNTPDTYLSEAPALYTNPTVTDPTEAQPDGGNGISNANMPPPFAANCVYWAGRAWYGNYCEVPSNTFRLLVVGGSGLVAGDTVTIDSIALTASAAPAAATDFLLVTGLSSIERNIEATARNIVEVYNRNAITNSKTTRAYYTSTSLSFPGQIQVFGASFPTFATSKSVAFQWDSSASLVWQKNGLRFSKMGQADHCAPCNVLFVGPAEAEIVAIRPLRDKLFVFTTKGIYVVTGTSQFDFTVSEFDLTFKLIGSSFVVECDDRLVGWFREGIAEITDGGVQIVSGPIEDWLNAYSDPSSYGYSYISEIGFAVSYRMRHQVLFFYPTNKFTNSVHCEKWLIWDVRTRAWTMGAFDPAKTYTQNGFTWFEGKSCAAVPVNTTEQDLIVAWGTNGSGNCYMFTENTGTAETNADGTAYAPEARVRFQFAAPSESDAMHWQQSLIHLPADNTLTTLTRGTPDDYATPTSFSVTHRAAGLSGAIAGAEQVVTTFSNGLLRVEPPADARRGQKMQLLLKWVPAGMFGIVGVTQVYRPGSGNPKGAP